MLERTAGPPSDPREGGILVVQWSLGPFSGPLQESINKGKKPAADLQIWKTHNLHSKGPGLPSCTRPVFPPETCRWQIWKGKNDWFFIHKAQPSRESLERNWRKSAAALSPAGDDSCWNEVGSLSNT